MFNIILSIFSAIVIIFTPAISGSPSEYEILNIKSFHKLKGKPTLLVFWSLHCIPCRRELPHLDDLYERYRNNVNFYAVVLGTKDIKKIEKAKKDWGFNIPVLLSGEDVFSLFNIIGTPTIIIFDKNLKEVKRFLGPQDTNKIENIIKTLL
ncbi:TlpA family protein disulfide reductase [Persephonella sp.]